MIQAILSRVKCADQRPWTSITFNHGGWEAQLKRMSSRIYKHCVDLATSNTAIRNNTWTF